MQGWEYLFLRGQQCLGFMLCAYYTIIQYSPIVLSLYLIYFFNQNEEYIYEAT